MCNKRAFEKSKLYQNLFINTISWMEYQIQTTAHRSAQKKKINCTLTLSIMSIQIFEEGGGIHCIEDFQKMKNSQ